MEPKTSSPQPPSIGRIVWFNCDGETRAAIVTFAYPSGGIDLVHVNRAGSWSSRTSVQYHPEGAPNTWMWPPRV